MKDIPGFYYDAEKNRYFPIKSSIPGGTSSSRSNNTFVQKTPTKPNKPKYGKGEVVKMLQARELCGNSVVYKKKKVNFQEYYQKIRTSKPLIWKYHGTRMTADAALEHAYVEVQTPDGVTKSEILLSACLNSTFCTYEVGCVADHANYGTQYMPDLVQPFNMETQTSSLKSPGLLWRAIGASVVLPSNVSCIKISRRYDAQTTDADSSVTHSLITTLGYGASGGHIYLINLSEPLEYSGGVDVLGTRMNLISSVPKSTVWTADCNSDGNRAVIGTNSGAALIHIESGTRTWICRSKSDVFSLQFDCSGNIVLCGLRNGAIVTVDTRQRPQALQHDRLPKYQIPGNSSEKQSFEFRGNIHRSRTIYMPSSVSCLAVLKLYDRYFLASSMDGTMRLYDHRLTQRGPVQVYEGNVNSHTRIKLGVDPSERFFMSGGEDFGLRAWCIKSGEMLYEDKFMNSVPSVVCWPRGLDSNRTNLIPGAWLGSQEGIFYVNTS